jgi:hypothetical protein
MTILTVRDIINSELAVSTEKGEMVFNAINEGLQKEEKIVLDFKGIDLMITAFLNAAIGKLYGNKKYSGEFLNEHIKLENIDSDDVYLFKDVIKRAKEYFEDKDGFDRNTNRIIYGEE